MNKLKWPKNPYKGLKIRCTICKTEPASCNHIDHHQYRIHVHVAGTKNTKKIKALDTRDYDEAVKQAIEFKQSMVDNNYHEVSQPSKVITLAPTPAPILQPVTLSITQSITLYKKFLSCDYGLAHLKKRVSDGHVKESIRFCNLFIQSLAMRINPADCDVTQITRFDVSTFYVSMESKYGFKSFNKCMLALKSLFTFVIDIEGVMMNNPFGTYIPKKKIKKHPISVSLEEYKAILKAIDTADPIEVLGGKRNERKSHFRSYLKDGIRLGVMSGLRREELVEMRWDCLMETKKGSLVLELHNLKVERIQNAGVVLKHIPVNADLKTLLIELGYNDKKNTSDYILHPDRTETSQTMMDALSKGFSHYAKAAGVTRPITFCHLRKSYISYVHAAMGLETGLLTSHSSEAVLKNHYIDPTVAAAIDKGASEIRIFGT